MFGSDSFLDILANIVGILIILIVVAGMRVSRSPAKPTAPASEAQTVEAASIVALPSIIKPTDEAALEPEPERLEETKDVIEAPTLSQELVDHVNSLQATLDRLQSRRNQLVSEERKLASQATQIRQSVASSHEALEENRHQLAQGSQALAALDESVRATARELAELRVTLEETAATQPDPTILQHKLNPVGRQVHGKQILFLLTGGRVAVVPTEAFLDAFQSKRQLIMNRLLRSQQYTGTLGPIQGFKMDYVVDRVTPTLVEELRYGTATFRARLSMWQFIPQDNLVTESADEALHPNGRFLAALRQAGGDDTLTFFVHPDSFAIHRELQDFAHEQGFEVAANPILSGEPISIVHAGSPLGTASVAQ